jgi:hypothetical protein
MKAKCQQKSGAAGRRTDEQDSCRKMADLFIMGTSIFGCGGYVELQTEGCECLSKRQAFSRIQEYAQEFYGTYNQTHSLPDAFHDKYLRSDETIRQNKQGEMVYQLYKKYPKSIEIISRDGKRDRKYDSFFHPPVQEEEN